MIVPVSSEENTSFHSSVITITHVGLDRAAPSGPEDAKKDGG